MAVDGLVSGLNTSQLIDQMMQIESRGQLAIRRQINRYQSAISAFQGLNTATLGLHTAASALTKSATWQAFKVTSSSDAVTASASTGASSGSVTFDVDQLAKASSWSSTNAVALTADIRDGSPLVITKNGVSTTITPSDNSLSATISAINANSGLGVRAAAVQIRPGEYLMQLTSTTTGAGGISVSGVSAAIGSAATAGTDARVQLNVGGTLQAVTSSTNTFSGMLPGVTFTVSKLATGVTLDLTPDSTAVADKVEAMVKAANAALDEIAKYASYDANTKVGGPLMTDSMVRTLQQKILGAISSSVAGVGTPKDAGIQLTSGGRLTFDRAAFDTAFNADPAKLQKLLGPSGTFAGGMGGLQGSISFSSATEKTLPGTYAVQVTQAATRASASITFGAVVAGDVITVASPSGAPTAQYVIQPGDAVDDVITGINAAAAAQKLGVAASSNGSGGITVGATAYGSAGTFTLSATGSATASAVTAGLNVAGTINGAAATGSGQVLTANATTDEQTGLAVKVTLTAADVAMIGNNPAGTFSYVQGVAQRLSSMAKTATDSIDGTLTRAITSRQDSIKGLETQIEVWDRRLEARRLTLQQTFSGLEQSLGKMRNQSSWLSGQLSALSSQR